MYLKLCISVIKQKKAGFYRKLKKLLIPLELLTDLLSKVREG